MSSVTIAYRNLTRRKARTILSISGIVVGVTMILVLLSLASGTSASTANLLRSVVTAQITVTNSTAPTLGGFTAPPGATQVQVIGGGPSPGSGPVNITGGGSGAHFVAFFGGGNTIPESYASTIANLKGVYGVSPELSTAGFVDNNSVFLTGIVPSSFTQVTTGLDIVNGSMLNSGNEIVLSNVLAQNLGVSVGSTITLSYDSLNSTNIGSPYTVVGIFSSGSTFAPTARTAYIELSNAQEISGKTGLVTEINVKTTNPSLVHTVASNIQNSVSGVTANTSSGVTSEASLSASLAIFFVVMGLVALLAGGFGVTNTMIMSVSERTREIGTLRAIGAQKRQVVKIFMSESFLIGAAGAIAGAIIGIIIAVILPYFSGFVSTSSLFGGILGGRLSTAIIPTNVLLSVALGVIVSIIAGIYPAMRASRMKPEEALRYG